MTFTVTPDSQSHTPARGLTVLRTADNYYKRNAMQKQPLCS